jgi:hypothetical protein
MESDIFQDLEKKVTNIGTDEIYKKKIGQLTVWFSPLNYVDQGFMQAALEDAANPNSLQTAKLKALARSIVGIDEIDLRPFRNSGPSFTIPDLKNPDNKSKKSKVDLAKYLEYKIHSWGQVFVDLAFDVFSDITETSKKKFSEGLVFDNAKDPRIELAELEVRVHELRSQLGLPVLEERVGSRYKNAQGEPEIPEPDGPTPDLSGVEFNPEPADETFSAKTIAEEESAEEEVEPKSPVVAPPAVDDILNSVEPPEPPPEPVRTIPIIKPAVPAGNPSPITQAMNARQNVARPVRQVPPNAVSSPTRPFDPTPSVNTDGVIEQPMTRANHRPRTDPSVTSQSVNPRFKHSR